MASTSALHTKPVIEPLSGRIPNTPLSASLISFLLGTVFSPALLLFLFGGSDFSWWSTWQLGLFVAAWAGFHWGEFAVTAGWNWKKCSVDSFLLDNGSTYHIANGTALTEYLISLYFFPQWKMFPYVSELGVILVLIGQALRSGAMIHASTSFSHAVQFEKRSNHTLVTTGIYAWFRHPSYAGFYYWAVGTQLVLQNPISFSLFVYLLWRFFYYRTRAGSIQFFGRDYENYRRRVGTWIPFVP
ncbi:Isoprenylcysteine carboxyl methyltransferase family-domain-containing protein [Flagelloscypha sp. PMI_526]|nr:Isoprenylcysteine carboxyl methyltransferase family-domain-containing protein [Flagelloscypha sp. PMI_526]